MFLEKSEKKQAMAAVRLSRLPGVGAGLFRNLIQKHGSPLEALEFYSRRLATEQMVLPGFSQNKSPTHKGIRAAKKFIEEGGKVVFVGHRDYPSLLLKIFEPPPVLFIRGKLLPNPNVAVVGTRYPDSDGIEFTRKITSELVSLGFTIVSGGALGVDTQAHKTALTRCGNTIAVFGSGVDVFYPRENKAIFEEIAINGALISELLPETTPMRSFFPTRNRIVAGLSLGTIVIQAGSKSGALITANFAKKFGRKVFSIQPPNSSTIWEGPNELLAGGAISISVQNRFLAEYLIS